jgi:GT2 family glycosyltransferase
MRITFVIPCIKTGMHLDATLTSIAAAAPGVPADIMVKILSPLPQSAFADLPHETRRLEIEIFDVDPVSGMMGKFDLFLAARKDYDTDDIFIFSNDDVIFSSNFLTQLVCMPTLGRILGPVIRQPDGRFQVSMFRKQFTFWRLMVRIHDGGLYSRLIKVPDTLDDNLNTGRKTVDGCCFILSEDSLRRFGRQFDFCAFLYMEEVIFQNFFDRYDLRSEVVRDLSILHLGGATLTHGWSRAKSRNQIASVTAVSSAYLGHSQFQTAILRSYFIFEFALRALIESIRR